MNFYKNLSIKSITFTILAFLGFLAIVVSFVSSGYFFNAARHAQTSNVKNILQVVTKEVMDKAHQNTMALAHSLAQNTYLQKIIQHPEQEDAISKISTALDEPFITGFVSAGEIDLVKVRIYDKKLNFITESIHSDIAFEKKMPAAIYINAKIRKGAARARSLSSFWLSDDGPYYSVLVPVGGIYTYAYLEVIINPVMNLLEVSDKMHMPIKISGTGTNKTSYYSPKILAQDILPVNLTVFDNMEKPVFKLTAYNDITNLNYEMHTTVYSTVMVFISLTAIVLAISLWLFQKLLFTPLSLMLNDIEKIRDGKVTHNLNHEGFSEISILSDAFNEMKNEVNDRTQELERLTSQDPLTGIANRRYFDESLRREYYDAYRNKQPISLLIIDIDYFKRFNDSNGHLAGDACLQAVTSVISKAVSRPADVVARYGGEEFAVILPSTPATGMKKIAELIQQAIASAAIPHDDSPISDIITLSIGGCTSIPSDKDRMTSIINEADKSLYEAKGAGRNQTIYCSTAQLDLLNDAKSA